MQRLLDGSGVGWRPGASVATAGAMLARSGRCDVVHAHMTAAELAAVITLPRTRGRLVVTRHFAQHRGATRAGSLAAKLIGAVPRTELAISQFVADRLEQPATIVFHGIEDVAAVGCDGRTIVVVQRLEAEKHTSVAIGAFASSGLANEGWELVVAGDGIERPSLERQAKVLGLGDQVRFLGRVADVDALRAGAAIQLASPPGEPFGLSVLEAMACGLPVVAAAGGAHPELLGDESSLLFPPGDEAAAGAALRHLAEDPVRRREIGSRLQRRQRDQFSLAAHGAALEQAYRTALGGE